MKQLGLKKNTLRILTVLSFVFVSYTLTAQISLTIYAKNENKPDSITSQRTYDKGYLIFDNKVGPNNESGNINLYLVDAISKDTLQKTSVSYIDKPNYIEGKGMLYVVNDANSPNTDSFALARLENNEDVWIIFKDSHVIFRGDIRFEESELK